MIIVFQLFFQNLLLFSEKLKLAENTFLRVFAHRFRPRLFIDTGLIFFFSSFFVIFSFSAQFLEDSIDWPNEMTLSSNFLQEQVEGSHWSFISDENGEKMIKPISEIDLMHSEADLSFEGRIYVSDFFHCCLNLLGFCVVFSDGEMGEDDANHDLMHLHINLHKRILTYPKFFFINDNAWLSPYRSGKVACLRSS